MPDGIVTVHFDLSGSVEDCAAFLSLIGFPVSTAMTADEQATAAAGLQATHAKMTATAGNISNIATQLKSLAKP